MVEYGKIILCRADAENEEAVMDAILTRRTIRKFKADAVSEQDIRYLLEAAMSAPSTGKQEPWYFMVITDKETLSAAADAQKHGPMLKQAPLAIVVAYDKTLEVHKNTAQLDCAAATQNMLVAANSKGLGAAWLGVYPDADKMKAVKKLFCMPANIVPFAIVAVGHPAEDKYPKARFVKSRVHYGVWQ